MSRLHAVYRPGQSAPASLLLVLLVLLCLGACTARKEPAAQAPAPTPVRTVAVVEGPATPPLEVTGIVTARDELKLSFMAGGIVQQVLVRDGDAVRKGQRLAQLDPTQIAAQVAQAQQMAEKAERDRQ